MPAGGRMAKVYFATDRQPDPGPKLSFSRDRTDPPTLATGWQQVALGSLHEVGKVDDVALTATFAKSQSPGGARESALKRTDAEIQLFADNVLRPALRSAHPLPGVRKQVLLFVHGYNNTFEYAVRKTAQLAGDLDLVDCQGGAHGVAITYSWPAQGSLLGYLADEEDAEWTQQRLAPFLRAVGTVCHQENAEFIVMAHSLGTRAAVRSLSDLAISHDLKGQRLVDHLILLAPDLSKALFDQYVERILPLVGHLSVYVSSKDRALAISRLLHGGNGRLGLVESTLLTALQLVGVDRKDHRTLGSGIGGFDIIDVSDGGADFIGHSYEDPAFIGDLKALIDKDVPPGTGSRSNLEPHDLKPGLFGPRDNTVRYFKMKGGAS